MILAAHWEFHQRLAKLGVLRSPLLMLGNQAVGPGLPQCGNAAAAFGILGVAEYRTLDLDGGDLRLDLNQDQRTLFRGFATVFNLGTLEHCWDAHTSWANALRAVREGGHFVTVSPIQGYAGHGIHLTDEAAIRSFVLANGFELVEEWNTVEPRGVNLWLAARKIRHTAEIAEFKKPIQAYVGGKKERITA